jgi:DNA repair ATPase RecN
MRLLGKYNIQKKENLDKMYRELKQKVLEQAQQLSRYRKDKTSTINIKCSKQTTRNFTPFSDRKIPV